MINELQVTTKDNLNFLGLYNKASQTDAPVILFIPGMSGIYDDSKTRHWLSEIPKNGVSFLSAGHRGTNSFTKINTKIIGTTYEIFEDCILDIDAWIEKLESLGHKEIWLMGYSLGTTKVAYYFDLKGKEKNIKGIIQMSPADNFAMVNEPVEYYSRHKYNLIEAKKLITENKLLQKVSKKLWDLVELSAQTYTSLWDNKNNFIYNYWEPEIGWEVARRTNVPFLAFTGTNDDGIYPAMNPKYAMKMLEKELVNVPRIKTVVFQDATHEYDGFEKNIAEEIINFVNAK